MCFHDFDDFFDLKSDFLSFFLPSPLILRFRFCLRKQVWSRIGICTGSLELKLSGFVHPMSTTIHERLNVSPQVLRARALKTVVFSKMGSKFQ